MVSTRRALNATATLLACATLIVPIQAWHHHHHRHADAAGPHPHSHSHDGPHDPTDSRPGSGGETPSDSHEGGLCTVCVVKASTVAEITPTETLPDALPVTAFRHVELRTIVAESSDTSLARAPPARLLFA